MVTEDTPAIPNQLNHTGQSSIFLFSALKLSVYKFHKCAQLPGIVFSQDRNPVLPGRALRGFVSQQNLRGPGRITQTMLRLALRAGSHSVALWGGKKPASSQVLPSNRVLECRPRGQSVDVSLSTVKSNVVKINWRGRMSSFQLYPNDGCTPPPHFLRPSGMVLLYQSESQRSSVSSAPYLLSPLGNSGPRG